MRETQVRFLEEGMATHTSILAWRILRQRILLRQSSLVGYSPWGCKELDMTEVTEHSCTKAHVSFHVSFIHAGMLHETMQLGNFAVACSVEN